jgi:DNA-binding HxlR family transcriptional regulator
MKRKTFGRMNCSIARALELVGEWWTMLILREAFLGTRRFQDFQRNLGIARNILSARLKKLVTRGLLQRSAAADGGRRLEYHLTEKGRAFFPVLMALMQWGDRFAACAGGAPIKVVERDSGDPIAEMQVLSRDGRVLTAKEVRIVPGPGAGMLTKARFNREQSSDPVAAETGELSADETDSATD